MNKNIFIPLLLTFYLWLPSCLLTLPVSALASLSFYGFIQEGNGRIEGLDGANLVAASHDDKFVYVASMEDDAITVLIRNPTTGEVIPIQVIKISWFGELNSVSSMVVSADDQLVYVTSNQDDAVAVFQRDTNTGQLNFIQQFLKDGQDGVDGLDGASSVAVSADNKSVYVAGNQDDAIAVFQRDINTSLLSFQQVLKDGQDNVDGLDGANSVAVSTDNQSVYVASNQDDAIAVFQRDINTGLLSFQQVLKDGQDNVDGLDGANSVVVSTDNQSVYVASNQDDTIAVFQRDTNTGQLSFQQVLKDGQDGVDGLNGASSVVVSANNQWVYVASYDNDAIAVFQRDTSTGQLSFQHVLKDGQNGVDGLEGASFVIVSMDSQWIYIAGYDDDAVAVFKRDPSTSELSFLQAVRDGQAKLDGLEGARSVTVAMSDFSQFVYVASYDDNAVVVFPGSLTGGALQIIKDGQNGVDGLEGANSVTVSADNQSVYVASYEDDAVAVFTRELGSGLLSFQQVLKNGQDGVVDGLDGASFVTVSADNKSVYVASHQNDAIAVFERDLNTGQLSFQQVLKDGQDNVDGLDGANSVAVSVDNQSVYVTSNQDDAVAVFQRDTNIGQLSFQQVLKDGQDGVDGLNGASSVVVSANNQWVYVASYDDDAIAVFQRDTNTGQLNFQYFLKDGQDGVEGLKGARSVAVGANDQLVYVASWDDSAIVLFQRDPSNGKLSLLQILRDSDDLNYNGFAQASSIHVAPNSNDVYVTGYKDDAVARFYEYNNYPDSSLSDFTTEIRSINENTSFTFEELRIYDDDAGIFPLRVTLTVTNGTLTLNSKEGLSFTEGDGTADSRLMFTDILTNINNALIGMTFTPTLNFGGEAIFEITTDDLGHTGSGGAQQDTDTLIIKVLPVNESPVIETIATQYGIPNKLLSFKVIATDPDVPKQNLTYQLINDPPPGASIDSKTGQFKWIPSSTQVGIFKLTVAVTDNGVNPDNLEVSQTFEVIVTDAPILKPIGAQTVLVDNTLTFTAQADFPEAPALTFSLLNAPPDAQIDKKTGKFTWTPTQTGEFSVTVVVTEPFDQRTAEETVIITVTQIPTSLELTLSSMAIFQNGHLAAKGKLTSYPQQPAGLKELPIQLQITAPDGSITTLEVTTTASGEYHFTQLPVLTQTGQYQLQAQFASDKRLAASQSEPQTVLVSALAGYALLVQGRDAKGKGQEAYGKSLNRVYQKLSNRGFIDDNINYLGYDQNQVGILVDDTPTKAKIQTALKTLPTRLNADPAPLYIVMVDHGDLEGNFHLDNGNHEEIAPTELDTWLTALEQGLNDLAKAQPRVIIIGSCYSGNFISALSKPGRILVTSTAPGEESYKGPKEPDEVRSGEYFIEALFAQLGQGYSLKTAFELATQSTELFTRADDTDFFNELFQDNAVQHPLLDDNSDSQGSNVLEADGQVATTIYLGLGAQYDPTAPDSPAVILKVTPTLYLEANITSAPLWAQVNQPSRVKGEQVFVDIRPPSLQLIHQGIEQRETLAMEGLERIELGLASSNEFRGQFDGFTQIGRYELFYFVVDSDTGDRSLLQRSLVYKNRTGNQPPTPVQLRVPQNANETPTTVIFAWQPSSDPDNDPVTYTFLLATEPSMQQIIYRQEELRMTMTYLTSESVIADPLNRGQLGLRDGTEYAWQVQAVDKYGAMSESPIFTFQTNDTNLPPGLGSLYVYNAVDFVSLENAILDFWVVDEWGNLILDANGLPIPVPQPTEIFQDQGFYNLMLPYGRRRATLRATGYQDQPVLIDTTDGLAHLRVAMTPVGGIPLQPGQLQLAAEQTRVNETQGQIALVVKRVGGDDGAVSVAYQWLPDGSASLGTDYHVEEGQLTWADQDSLPKKILVTLLDDDQKESDETFALRLNNPGGGATLGTPNTITITLLDDEVQQPLPPGTLPSQASTYTEEPVGIQLEEPIQTITDNEITPTQPKENTVIVPPQPGDTTSPQTNPLTTDTPLVITSSESQASILQFITNTYYLNEGIGSVSAFTVTRSGGNQGAVSVKYTTTTTGTADIGIDYVGGTGLLTWADGDDIPKVVEIQVIDDSQSEGPETIQLQLANPTGNAQLGIDDHAILIIADNNTATAASSVSVPNSELNKSDIAVLQFESALHWGQEEDGEINLIITRTGSSQGEVAVNYLETLHSNATSGEDYLNGSGSLIWADGDNQPKTITLNLIDDDFLEAEFIHLVLVKPLGQAVLGQQSETVIILQDQDEVNPVQAEVTSIQLVKPIEIITESQNEVLIPVIRTGTQGYAAINYETVAGSATADKDYLPRQGRLVWQPGEDGIVGLIIPIVADSQPESEESFTLRLFNPNEGVQLGQWSQVEIRIQDQSSSIEIQDSPQLPNLGRGLALAKTPSTHLKTSLNCQAFPCLLKAAFRGGSSLNGLSYHQQLTLHPDQYVNIRGEMDVAAEHVGQVAELLVVAAWKPLNSAAPESYFMQDSQGQILPWDLNLAHLVATQRSVTLMPTQEIDLYTGFLSSSGQIRLFFGYQLSDGVIVFNGEQAVELVVKTLAED